MSLQETFMRHAEDVGEEDGDLEFVEEDEGSQHCALLRTLVR